MGMIFERLKQTKGAWLLVIGLIAGLWLLWAAEKEETAPAPSEAESSSSREDTDDYLSSLERRIVLLLEAMDGISEVSVILTADRTEEALYAQDDRYGNGSLPEQSYVILDVNGDDHPLLLGRIYPRIRGAAVVCRGGSSPILQEKIISMLCSLLGLSANNVYVTG